MKIRVLALAASAAMLLSSCGFSEARDKALAEASVQPLPMSDHWMPGFVAYPDYPAQGLGPAGYPGVSGDDTALDDPVQQMLADVGLQQSDFPSGYTVALAQPEGDSLGVPTLDFCDGVFPSDQLRVTRRQVEATGASSPFSYLSTEIVQYVSISAAQQALGEIITTAQRCKSGYQYVDADGISHTLQFHAAPGPSSTVLVPLENRAIFHYTDVSNDFTDTLLLAYQIHGNTLVAFYSAIDGETPMEQTELDMVYGLISKVTTRLLSLEGSDVGL